MNITAYKMDIRKTFRISLLIIIFSEIATQAYSQQAPMSLKEVKAMVQLNNQQLHISRLRVSEMTDSVTNISSNLYPKIAANALDLYSAKTNINLNGLGLSGAPVNNGFSSKHNIFAGQLQAQQPLTQLTRISTGVKIAKTNVELSKQANTKAEWQIGETAETNFYNILISQKQLVQANVNLDMLKEQLYDIQSALIAGKTDSVNFYNLEAQLASQQQKVLLTQNQIDNYKADLNVLLGRSADASLALSDSIDSQVVLQPIGYYQEQAVKGNPDIKIAGLTEQKAALAVSAAKKEFIPNLSAFAGYSRQDVIDFIGHNNFNAGVTLSWTILDWGARSSIVHQRQTQVREAAANLSYTKEFTRSSLEKSYRNAAQSLLLITAAEKIVRFRQREVLIRQNAKLAGKALKQDVLVSMNNLAQAEADYFSAQLTYRIAVVQLEITAGSYRQ
ncbi:TolC family protein [Pedobacter sp. L105]|uniref:TolC family protein n=1 Tax=Pedobacter sp. L105 TaxID=1641871 RepID=UPI00131C4B1F|nr:TolC family protein [Pedobacter sp. L105]